MAEDASNAERGSLPGAREEGQDLFIPSFGPNSVPSSPTHTLSRSGAKSPTSPGGDRTQVSAITVVALLDKLVNMLEAVQENQGRMEQRQADLEGAVRNVQGDVTRLTKGHAATAGSVGKLLERSRKVAAGMKETRERLERQSAQVKRLEGNHAHLLKRNHFKVLIFQEDNEIPSTVFMKDPAPRPPDADEPVPLTSPAADANRSHEEGLHTVSLTSDEDEDVPGPLDDVGEEVAEEGAGGGLGGARAEWSRSEKFKRSSLKKVDSLKKAFSRESIEKKMNKIGTKIVPPERREKLKKSFAPNHPKSPTSKSSSFHVAPMTFNVKKVRDGQASPADGTHVEMPALGDGDAELPLAEVHSRESRALDDDDLPTASTPPGSADGGASVNGDVGKAEVEGGAPVNGDVGKAEVDGDGLPEGGEEEKEGKEQESRGEEAAAPTPAALTVVQAS